MDDLQYSFASKPRAVQTVRGKHRDKKKYTNTTFNIMNDPRVARGSVYAAANSIHHKRETVTQVNQQPAPTKPKKSTIYEPAVTLQTYFPVDLEKNLIEQAPHIDEMDAMTQTDAFLPNDKHKKPFVLKKTGIDAATEITEEDALFDFDMEVQPMLEVLVQKTIKQALCEVEREVELKNIATYLEELHTNKALEADKVRELVAAAKEAYAVKSRKKEEQKQLLAEFDQVNEKVAAASLGRTLAAQVLADTMTSLTAKGVFYDPLHKQVEGHFMKWMYETADSHVRSRKIGQTLLEDVVGESLRHQTILQHVASIRDGATGMLTLNCSHKNYGIDQIGPLVLPSQNLSSVGEVEAYLQRWIDANAPSVARPPGGFLADLIPRLNP
ncbi:hypothetical protein Ae201684P_001599 [Aphanomyces euteiches]|nr:hypothetical protein Ae201684P_001599 [Aphanomyces euteiches]